MGKKIGNWVVKSRIIILIAAFVLLIPSALGYMHTRINYDLLTYLPKDIETMKGQDILQEEFGSGAFSMFIAEGMEDKDVQKVEEKIKEVPGVKDVIWYDTLLDISVPKELLPDDAYEMFNSDDATMMLIIFDGTTSSDDTVAAVTEIRQIVDKQCFVSGMTSVLIDTKDLSESEAPVYVGIAVALSCLVLMLAMDSSLVPFLFLASIGMAIVYNLGTNQILGSISYVTKALAAVLQLGVTMDYSIFLWHSYETNQAKYDDRNEAMAEAINETFSSIVGSSITTVAGFIALCFMSFTLGMDIGLVMAKGVVLGVISCITILPSLILTFDKALKKTHHKPIIPDFTGIGHHVQKHTYKYLVAALVILGPAIYGYTHMNIYYKMDDTLPKDLPGIIANKELESKFDMNATHVLMIDSSVPAKEIVEMSNRMKEEPGVKWVLGLNTIKGPSIPDAMIPDKLKSAMISDNYQLIMIGSEYEVASDEVNQQVTDLAAIAKEYDADSMLIGEAPCTKDLVTISNHDFNSVSWASILIIFVIIAFVFRSLSLPVILVTVIEFGIFCNMGVSHYTGTALPFIASVVIGTIQLGSTVDYAILMTTRYRRNRTAGMEKQAAIADAVEASAKSIFVSALSFFAATFGVGLYSNIDMISALCILMARGAIISMACVIFLLPSLLLIFDTIISKTTKPQRG